MSVHYSILGNYWTKSKMYLLLLAAILIQAAVGENYSEEFESTLSESPTTNSYAIDEVDEDLLPKCLYKYPNPEEKPYLVPLFLNCDRRDRTRFRTNVTTAIISAKYVLGLYIDVSSKCRYFVQVGADKHGRHGTVHAVETIIETESSRDYVLREIHQLALYKLTNPIEFGPRAQPISILEERPKTGTAAIVTGFKRRYDDELGNKIYEMNRTVTSEQDWRALHDKHMIKSLSFQERTLATVLPKDRCREPWTAALIVNGKLAGFMNAAGSFRIGAELFRANTFLDATYHKDWIEKHSDII